MMGASEVGPTLCANATTTSPPWGSCHTDEDCGFTESLLTMHARQSREPLIGVNCFRAQNTCFRTNSGRGA
jgi:hypothetical protein